MLRRSDVCANVARTLADLKRELYLIQQAQNRFLVSRLRNTLDAYVNRYLNRASQMSALR